MRDERERLFIDSLSVGYSGKAVLSDITLRLERGEIMTLIGPNGSGKTTLLRTLARQLAPIAGTVYVDGRSMSVMSGRELAKKTAAVMTDRVIPELTTCREFASAGRYPYTGGMGLLTDADREIVSRALETVNADGIAELEISSVSDGQRQRVLLARAICQQPEIIILDEPASFLDIKYKTGLLESIRKMAKQEGVAVIMSMHELDLAAKISDKIVCVKDDGIDCCGAPEEIMTEQRIAMLYDVDRRCYNPLLGSVELAPEEGEPVCFVIGGGGRGIPFYRALRKNGFPFAAGILFENDVDFAVASALAAEVVCTEAFEPIGGECIDKARKCIDAVGTVIDSGCPVGQFNRANASLLEYARDKGKRIISSLAMLAEAEL